jgi:parallel beta-helix repeat protein
VFLRKSASLVAALSLAGAVTVVGTAGTAGAATCTGVQMGPADNITTTVKAKPRGTVFCLSAGVYNVKSAIEPKAGMKFFGAPGAILDGSSAATTVDGFNGFANGATGVTLDGVEIRNFRVGVRAARAWIISGNDIHNNSQEGVRLTFDDVLKDNHVHHNTLGGVQGAGDNLLVVNNEINANHSSTSKCSQKFVEAKNLVVRNNYVHHNLGCPALWADINSTPLFEGNTIIGNNGPGIDCEISYNCVVRDNVLRDNGRGIIIMSTPNAEVYGNTVINSTYWGIAVTQQGTSEGIRTDHPSPLGPHVSKNAYIHDNFVTMATGFTGISKYGNVGDAVYSDAANNRFVNNEYRITSDARYFKFADRSRIWSEWRGFDQDKNGTIEFGTPGICTIDGTAGNDVIHGLPGDDVICAHGGDDVIVAAQGGSDQMIGGTGTDMVSYESATGPVNVNLLTGRVLGTGVDSLSGVEDVNGSSFGDTFEGNTYPNKLDGGGGNDALLGDAGDDRLFGGLGDDSFVGGDGNDLCDQSAGTGSMLECES